MADEDIFTGLDEAEDVPAAAEPAADASTPAPEAAAPVAADQTAAPAAAAPEAPAAAPKAAEPAARQSEAPDPSKWVPVGAHIDLREQMKALRAELDALKNPPKAAAPAPEFEQDPKGYVDHKLQAALNQLENGTKQVQQTAQQAMSAATDTQFRHILSQTEQQFAQAHPDYTDALNHLRTLRVNEILMLNPDLHPQQVQAEVLREELGLATTLMRSGRNPSEVAYKLAQSRGYVSKAQQSAAPAAKQAAQPAKQAAQPANVSQLLPNVPSPKTLAPDMTLGTGAGAPAVAEDITSDSDVFDQAFAEMFGRKRA